MTSSTSNSNDNVVMARVLAILLPVWIIGGFVLMLGRIDFQSQGDVVPLWEKKIFDNSPRVVVFGNSIAKRDVAPEVLAEQLDLPRNKVTVLTVPDSGGSLWYAALKNRVYAQGVIPDLIIVVSDLSSALGVEPITEEDHRNLMLQLSNDEPVISKKAFGGQSFWWLKLRQHRGDLRQALLHTVRDYAVGGVFAQHKTKLQLKGRAEVVPALERVFEAENVNWDLHHRVIPIVETPDYLGVPDLPGPRESMLPELIKLANDHGSAFAFVRTPLAPGNTDDTHTPEKERETVALLNEMNAGYIDMRSLDLRDRHFEDRVHMNRTGSQLFTKAVATALVELGALTTQQLPPAVLPVTLKQITREGAPPPAPSVGDVKTTDAYCQFEAPLNNPLGFNFEGLAKAGLLERSPFTFTHHGQLLELKASLNADSTCESSAFLQNNRVTISPRRQKQGESGEFLIQHVTGIEHSATPRAGHWVYPGTSLTLHFDESWQGAADSFTLNLTSEAFSDGKGEPTIRFSDYEATTIPRTGNRLKIQLAPPPPESAWTVTIASPEDGPYLLLQGLVVGEGYGASSIIGTASDTRAVAIRLIGGMHTEGIEPDYPEAPPPLYTPDKIRRGNRMSALYKVPTFSHISDKATKNRTPFGNSCSPIRVAENGRVISSPHHTCVDVNARGRGRMCHQEDNIYFSASDNTYPGTNERTYELQLDSDRQCVRAWWLYPQDRLLVRPSEGELARFRDGLQRLELDAIRFAPFEIDVPYLQVLLRVNGKEILTEQVRASVLRTGAFTRDLDEVIPPGTTDIELEIINPDPEVFWLMTMASLSEHEGDSKEHLRVAKKRITAFPSGSVSITREGDGPTLESVADVERTKSPCGYRFKTPYPEISDTALNDSGHGRASPLLLMENGQPLKPHATVREFQGRCAGAFGHTGRFVWFSPTGEVDAGLSRNYQLTLAPNFPTKRANGSPVYWVYPGTKAVVSLVTGWNDEFMGEFGVLTNIQSFFTADANADAIVRMGDQTWPVKDLLENPYIETPAPEGPVELEIESPPNGPYLMLNYVGFGGRGQTIPALGQLKN